MADNGNKSPVADGVINPDYMYYFKAGKELQELGFFPKDKQPSGTNDDSMKQAVKTFQASANIKADGVLEHGNTRTILAESYSLEQSIKNYIPMTPAQEPNAWKRNNQQADHERDMSRYKFTLSTMTVHHGVPTIHHMADGSQAFDLPKQLMTSIENAASALQVHGAPKHVEAAPVQTAHKKPVPTTLAANVDQQRR